MRRDEAGIKNFSASEAFARGKVLENTGCALPPRLYTSHSSRICFPDACRNGKRLTSYFIQCFPDYDKKAGQVFEIINAGYKLLFYTGNCTFWKFKKKIELLYAIFYFVMISLS